MQGVRAKAEEKKNWRWQSIEYLRTSAIAEALEFIEALTQSYCVKINSEVDVWCQKRKKMFKCFEIGVF